MMKNKRGVSGVIGVVILIALVMAAAILVWVVVRNMIEGKLEGTSCVDAYDQITLNPKYTCFDNTNTRVVFSINRKDMDIGSILIVVASGGTTKTFELTSTDTDVTGIEDYPTADAAEKMPGKNEGATYRCTVAPCTTSPDSVEIAPVIDNKQCESSDSITDIPLCSELGVT